jgi:hypothetical protein
MDRPFFHLERYAIICPNPRKGFYNIQHFYDVGHAHPLSQTTHITVASLHRRRFRISKKEKGV